MTYLDYLPNQAAILEVLCSHLDTIFSILWSRSRDDGGHLTDWGHLEGGTPYLVLDTWCVGSPQ